MNNESLSDKLYNEAISKTYMIRLHHVKKVDLSGSRTDKVKAIKDGYWKIDEELKSWALENASDEQINEWYKDCI